MEIIVLNSNKWNKNFYSILLDKTSNIQKKRKKKFSSKIKINYKFGSCEYPAKIRVSGDWKDHIKEEFASLDIKLIKGNIAGITKFKLFLPETRKNDGELVINLLFNNLGILAPRTKYLDITFNQKKPEKFIFQEKINKELLEYEKRREAPLFEGDEKFLWPFDAKKNQQKYVPIALVKQLNKNWEKKNQYTKAVSNHSFKILLDSYIQTRANESIRFHPFLMKIKNEYIKKLWQKYFIVMILMKGDHGLTISNQKIYWNPYEFNFEPIIYDSDSIITFNDEIFDKEVNLIINTNNDFQKYIKYFLHDFDFDELYEKLFNLLYDENFFLDLKKKGLEMSMEEFQKKISIIKKNYSYLQNVVKKNNKKIPELVNLDQSKKIIIDKLNKLNIDAYVVKSYEQNKYFYCFNAFKCKNKRTISLKELKKLSKENYVVYYLNDLGDDEQSIYFSKILNKEIITSKSVTINEDIKNNTISIIHESKYDWTLFNALDLGDISIDFITKIKSSDNHNSKTNYSKFTGCLNFYKVRFRDTKIMAKNAYCEDAINIIDSKGKISDITIENSMSDSLDADFSDIKINEISIKNSKNDCVDVSGGKYDFNLLDLRNCGDKGLSIGESSMVKVESIRANKATIGVASKDSSITRIKTFSGQNLSYCLSAYNKKQEFDGAEIYVNKYNCTNKSIKHDNYSRIIIR